MGVRTRGPDIKAGVANEAQAAEQALISKDISRWVKSVFCGLAKAVRCLRATWPGRALTPRPGTHLLN
jgi:hypothetical protein